MSVTERDRVPMARARRIRRSGIPQSYQSAYSTYYSPENYKKHAQEYQPDPNRVLCQSISKGCEPVQNVLSATNRLSTLSPVRLLLPSHERAQSDQTEPDEDDGNTADSQCQCHLKSTISHTTFPRKFSGTN